MKISCVSTVIALACLMSCSSTPADPDEQLFKDLFLRFKQHEDAVARSDVDTINRLNRELGDLSERNIERVLSMASADTVGSDGDILERKIVAVAGLGMVRPQAVQEHHDFILATLTQALNDNNNYVRSFAAGSLGHLALPRTPIDTLVKMLGDPVPSVRKAASYSLSLILPPRQNENILPNLMKSLSDPDPGVRLHTILALGKIGSVQACEPLIQELKNTQEPEIRKNAALALGRLQYTTLTPNPQEQLQELLGSYDEPAAQQAWDTLSLINRVNNSLIELLRDPNTELTHSGGHALKMINGRDVGRDYSKWKVWQEEKERGEKELREAGIRKRKLEAEKNQKEKKPDSPQTPPPPNPQQK